MPFDAIIKEEVERQRRRFDQSIDEAAARAFLGHRVRFTFSPRNWPDDLIVGYRLSLLWEHKQAAPAAGHWLIGAGGSHYPLGMDVATELLDSEPKRRWPLDPRLTARCRDDLSRGELRALLGQTLALEYPDGSGGVAFVVGYSCCNFFSEHDGEPQREWEISGDDGYAYTLTPGVSIRELRPGDPLAA